MGIFPNAGSVAMILSSCTVGLCSEGFKAKSPNGAYVQLSRTEMSNNICIYGTKRLQENFLKNDYYLGMAGEGVTIFPRTGIPMATFKC